MTTPSKTSSSSTSSSSSTTSPVSSRGVIFPHAQHFVSKDSFHNEFSADIPPVITVAPGELIHVETNDCFHGQVHPGLDNPSDVALHIPANKRNPITGPIYVEGAMPGDILAVELVDIRPQGIGVACCGPFFGQLCHWTPHMCTKFFDLSDHGKLVTMRNDERLPQQPTTNKRPKIAPICFAASPMLGVIGVAPPTGKISTMPAGTHGGNLDNKCNGIASTIYLPVHHPGALLSMGDMHASQGDGEICGTGVEIGGHVLLKCSVVKQEDLYDDLITTTTTNGVGSSNNNHKMRLEYPVTETRTHWITHGVVVENIPQTTTVACEEAAKILCGQWGFTPEEAFIFLSVKGDLGMCQSCYPDQGTQIAKMTVPKLDCCPRPFRALWKTDTLKRATNK